MAKYFAHATFGAGAFHRNADGRCRGDHAHARSLNWGGWSRQFSANLTRAAVPPEREGTAILSTPVLPRLAKITLPSQMLLGAETHGAKEDTASLTRG